MAWYCPRCGRVAEQAGSCAHDGAELAEVGVQDRIGQQLGEYRLTARLGSGAFGHVYRAVHERSGLVVAIKLLDQTIDQPDSQRAFTEARAAATIRHPNVVQVYDLALTDERRPYIVMEFLEGQTLADRWHGRAVAPGEVIAVASAILRGLEAAHARGVIHRDLKPANVFVVGDLARVVIVDFGLAKLMADPNAVRLTVTGASLGTPRYMAPEQVRNQPVDGRTDLYALGVMMFEALAGQPPFSAASTFELLDAHVSSPAPELPGTVPRPLVDAIDRALAKSPAERFASAAAMRAALAPAAKRSRTTRGLVAGAVSALAATGIAVAMTRPTRSVPREAVPPALPGEPPLTHEHERMLKQYSVNIAAGSYSSETLASMACQADEALGLLRGHDPEAAGFTRRFAALLRSRPEVAAIPCARAAPVDLDEVVRSPVGVPPPLPGDPPLDPRDEVTLTQIARTIGLGVYKRSQLVDLLCNTRRMLAYLVRRNDPQQLAFQRRLLRLFRSVPGLERTTCPDAPSP